MRIIYAILLSFIGNFALQAQTQLQLVPLNGNAAVRTAAAQEKAAFEAKYGVYNADEKVDCPPNVFFENTVTAGDSISITLDTVGTRIADDTLTSVLILPCSTLDNGTADGNQVNTDNQIQPRVKYFADAATLVGFDTLCIELCANNLECDTLNIPVFVKRAGRSYDVTGPTLATFGVVDEFCVDETLLEGELACSEVIECEDDYDGEGQQTVYPSLFSITGPCIFYGASGFPGEDLVCYEMCDEFGICDTFNVTYTITGETINLPIFEDFANNNSVYPDRDLWLDRDVYINDHMAFLAPSIGVATFDGLDPSGTPYDFSGRGDALTSKRIDLSGLNEDDNVYFKCYVSAEGFNTLTPDLADSLVLEFRKANNQWETVGSWNVDNTFGINTPFEFFALKLEETNYFHEAFQFRFQSIHSPGGLNDIWHVDYIKLEANDNETPIVNDVAFVSPPRSILERYSAMPWSQFAANISDEVRNDSIVSGYFNHDDESQTVSASSAANIINLTTGSTLSATTTVTNAENVNSQSYRFISNQVTGDFWNDVKSELSAFPSNTEKADLSFQYTIDLAQAPFARNNDTTNFVTHLDNYYAYDDGTAETAIVLINQQNDDPEYAIRYRANVADQLVGVRMQFPNVRDDNAANQRFNIKVWIDPSGSEDFNFIENNDPDYIREFVNPLYPDTFTDSLQAFTTYNLQDEDGNFAPLDIPAGADFYLGFQQASQGSEGIFVGFDVQTDARQHSFLNLGDFWFPMPSDFTGSIIYNPILGNNDPGNTAVDNLAEAEENAVRLFPNPTSGEVNVVIEKGNYHDYQVEVYNQTGQLVRTLKGDDLLNLGDLQTGVYQLKFVDENSLASYFRRVIIAK